MRACAICGKRSVVGRHYIRRGQAKVKGGVGRRIVRKNLRRFQANLQRVKVLLNGSPKRVLVCTECIKHGRVRKVPPRVRQAE